MLVCLNSIALKLAEHANTLPVKEIMLIATLLALFMGATVGRAKLALLKLLPLMDPFCNEAYFTLMPIVLLVITYRPVVRILTYCGKWDGK